MPARSQKHWRGSHLPRLLPSRRAPASTSFWASCKERRWFRERHKKEELDRLMNAISEIYCTFGRVVLIFKWCWSRKRIYRLYYMCSLLYLSLCITCMRIRLPPSAHVLVPGRLSRPSRFIHPCKIESNYNRIVKRASNHLLNWLSDIIMTLIIFLFLVPFPSPHSHTCACLSSCLSLNSTLQLCVFLY